MERLLGISLMVGGILIGIIITGLAMLYMRDGSLTTGQATIGTIIGLLLLALPQLSLGIFLVRKSQTPE